MIYEPRINEVKPSPQNQQKKKRRYLFRTIILLVLALPIALYFRYQWEVAPNKYFWKRCADIGGEIIHKQVKDVKGFLLARRREPRDFFARIRKLDFPEDPYHHTNAESKTPAKLFLAHRSFEYIEMPTIPDDVNNVDNLKYIRYLKNDRDHSSPIYTDSALSRYELSWKDISNNTDREFGVHIGTIKIRDISSSQTLASHTGLMLYNSHTNRIYSCPKIVDGPFLVSNFVRRILKPVVN